MYDNLCWKCLGYYVYVPVFSRHCLLGKLELMVLTRLFVC